MWKHLYGMVRDVFLLRHRVDAHDKRLDGLSRSSEETSDDVMLLAQRILRLELQLEHQKEQQTTERENFRLQLENLILRLQQGLPPSSQTPPPIKDSTTKPPKDDETVS